MIHPNAYLLRENTGTTGLEVTAHSAVSALAAHDIPHLLIGGLAVQEHGYHRVTLDVDLVVPDVLEAVEFLTADPSGPFIRVTKLADRVQDRRTGVFVDFLPAGKVLRTGCQVPFPQPGAVSRKPNIVPLEQLLALKLDSWANSPTGRHKDKSDVIELIKVSSLPRELAIDTVVRHLYLETWDALHNER